MALTQVFVSGLDGPASGHVAQFRKLIILGMKKAPGDRATGLVLRIGDARVAKSHLLRMEFHAVFAEPGSYNREAAIPMRVEPGR